MNETRTAADRAREASSPSPARSRQSSRTATFSPSSRPARTTTPPPRPHRTAAATAAGPRPESGWNELRADRTPVLKDPFGRRAWVESVVLVERRGQHPERGGVPFFIGAYPCEGFPLIVARRD